MAPSVDRSRARASIKRWARSRVGIVATSLSLAIVVGALRWSRFEPGSNETESLRIALERSRGLRLSSDAVAWMHSEGGPFVVREALVLGARNDELPDVYFVALRQSESGAVLDLISVSNLTSSPTAAEEQLRADGRFAAFLSRTNGQIEAATLLELDGERESDFEGWTAVQRAQHAITNLEETGRAIGFGRARYQGLSLPEAELHLDDDALEVQVAGAREPALRVELPSARVLLGHKIEVQSGAPGQPGGITWVVDTVRGLSFVGPKPIEWLENKVFALEDAWRRTRHRVFGSQRAEMAAREELGITRAAVEEQLSEERRALLDEQEALVGFPPAPMRPIIEDDPARGEGEWIPVIDDPFVNQNPNAPPAFAQSFIRPDVERPYVQVYVTTWDPRQVQLRIVSGTREPTSATGELGSGTIPRDERTLSRLVGAFDGGFQAMHGEFGMMSEGRVFLPPKPWAATVAVFDDGRVGMGSWPAPNWRGAYFDEALANRQIPPDMIEMRQNLTSVVEDGIYNPWQRWWWGAAPQESEEQTFTYRSGLCLTEAGFLSFFWGSSLGPEALGAAMIAARCVRAMHLDMNSGHCGFEFYRPYRREGPPPPPVARVHTDYELDAELPGSRAFRIRGRKAVRSMAMRFPRYTARDPRDFFYLTLKPVLPGPNLADGTAFSTVGLPHRGWPYPFARAEFENTWLVRIDFRRAIPSALRQERHAVSLAVIDQADEGPVALYAHRTLIGHELRIGSPERNDQVIVRGTPIAEASEAGAAIGIDPDGFIVYVEGPNCHRALAAAHVEDALALRSGRLAFRAGPAGAAPDGLTEREIGSAPSLEFFAEEAPAAQVVFPETRPMPYRQWNYMQGQRVRYFPEHAPRFSRDAGVVAP